MVFRPKMCKFLLFPCVTILNYLLLHVQVVSGYKSIPDIMIQNLASFFKYNNVSALR